MTNAQIGPRPHVPADFDVVVVGAGMGGIYAVHNFRKLGLSVHGIESAADVGGVWYHNRYPGARVDIESYFYSFCFDPELYREWAWTERYPAQPEILAYLNAVADKHDIRSAFEFNSWMTGAAWDSQAHRYTISTDNGLTYTAQFLVMTSGQLSKPRPPKFKGLESFRGEWVQTSQWPDRGVETAGKRIAVLGTGSSGVQAIPILAEQASQLYVFQRTANYSIPAQNSPIDVQKYETLAQDSEALWQELLHTPSGSDIDIPEFRAVDLNPDEQRRRLEDCWTYGGHSMNLVFTDQGTNKVSNDLVAEFVREKVRSVIEDPNIAAKLIPTEYPIGSRRLCVDTNYYQTFNRENVELVSLKGNPIERITPAGVMTADGHEYAVDLIVFALGFDAFTGSLDSANIRNETGEGLVDSWKRGPKTFLGLMTCGFPNLFLITGPGSPSVLANMIACNVQHLDLVGTLLEYMAENGHHSVEPTVDAQNQWTAHVAEAASNLLRLNVENYMVHVNRDDGSRVFQPYAGGFGAYVQKCDEVVASKFEGLKFK